MSCRVCTLLRDLTQKLGAGSELTKPNIFPPFYVKEHMTMASNWPPTKRSNNDLASMLASYETNPRVIPQGEIVSVFEM